MAVDKEVSMLSSTLSSTGKGVSTTIISNDKCSSNGTSMIVHRQNQQQELEHEHGHDVHDLVCKKKKKKKKKVLPHDGGTTDDANYRVGPGGWTNLYPWSYIPEPIQLLWGLLCILPLAPFMAVLIGVGEVTWAILVALYKRSTLAQRAMASFFDGARFLARRWMHDERDYPLLPPILFLSVYAPALVAWAAYRYVHYGHEWWFFFFVHFLRMGPRFRMFAYLHVLVHKEGHDTNNTGGFWRIKGPLGFCLNHASQWWLGLFYGQVCTSYSVAHNKIHHRFDGQLLDCHTNLDVDRSKPYNFLLYAPRFYVFWMNISPFLYMVNKRDWKFAFGILWGNIYYYSIIGAVLYWDWWFGLCYAIFPLMQSCFFLAGISYLWHAFIDPEDPTNQFVLSLTILNGRDNIWGEDYHVVHHICPRLHWSQYEDDYKQHESEYAENQATIFKDTEEGELIFYLLSAQWDKLAERFVDLNGVLTFEEKRALLLRRLSHVVRDELITGGKR